MKPQETNNPDLLEEKTADATTTAAPADEKADAPATQTDATPSTNDLAATEGDLIASEKADTPSQKADTPSQKADNSSEKAEKETDESLPELRKLVQEEDSLTGISLKALMGGDFFGSNWFRKQLLYVFFVAFLCILYITNRYSYQEELINKRVLTIRLEDRHKRAVVAESELTYFCRRAHIQSLINDSTLKMSRENYYYLNVPPANPQTADGDGAK